MTSEEQKKIDRLEMLLARSCGVLEGLYVALTLPPETQKKLIDLIADIKKACPYFVDEQIAKNESVAALSLSVRTTNLLTNNGIVQVEDILQYTREKLQEKIGGYETPIREICDKLCQYNLCLKQG